MSLKSLERKKKGVGGTGQEKSQAYLCEKVFKKKKSRPNGHICIFYIYFLIKEYISCK